LSTDSILEKEVRNSVWYIVPALLGLASILVSCHNYHSSTEVAVALFMYWISTSVRQKSKYTATPIFLGNLSKSPLQPEGDVLQASCFTSTPLDIVQKCRIVGLQLSKATSALLWFSAPRYANGLKVTRTMSST